MKAFLLILCGLLLAAPLLVAQDIDPAIQQAITNAVPPAYAGWAALVLLIIAGFFRFLTAKENGLSNAAAFLATLKGTNVPKNLPLLLAGFCMLSLSSCAFLSSQAGQALIVSLVEIGLKSAVAKGKVSEGDQVTIQKSLAVVTNPNDSTVVKVFTLAELGLKSAVDKGVLKQGDALLIQEASVVIKSAVVTPQEPNAKQPVKVKPTAAVKPRQNRLKPGLQYLDGPGCMQLADRIPVYGERVAFMLSTAEIRN